MRESLDALPAASLSLASLSLSLAYACCDDAQPISHVSLLSGTEAR